MESNEKRKGRANGATTSSGQRERERERERESSFAYQKDCVDGRRGGLGSVRPIRRVEKKTPIKKREETQEAAGSCPSVVQEQKRIGQ